MKRLLLPLALGLFLFGTSCKDSGPKTYRYQPFNNELPIDVPPVQTPDLSDDDTIVIKTPDTDKSRSEPLTPTPEILLADYESLKAMLSLLFSSTVNKPVKSYFELIQFLQETHQEPTVAKDSNPHTGSLTIIRTYRPLFGTRYFHAQYISDNDEVPIAQHISFEFRPSTTAWETALSLIKFEFPELAEPYINEENLLAWHLPDSYHIYIKRLTEDDLEDHPFNAYMKSDIGTLSIAIELNPHALVDVNSSQEEVTEEQGSTAP